MVYFAFVSESKDDSTCLLLLVNLVVQACICADYLRARRSDMEVLSQLFGRLGITRHTYRKDHLENETNNS